MSFGSDFNKYYNQNMNDMSLPPITSGYGVGTTLGAGLKSFSDLTNKYGNYSTIQELVRNAIAGKPAAAGTSVVLEAMLAGFSAYYLGVNVGSAAVATGKALADNFDVYNFLHGDNSSDWKNANRNGKFHLQKDPLTLDLDGDGIETVSTNGYKGALFDHSKSGIKTATGWVSADDGFLIVDKNGDGIVNNGDELFGNNYTLVAVFKYSSSIYLGNIDKFC